MRNAWGLRLALNIWRRHAGVRPDCELTVGERAADHLRHGMGSWPFVFGALSYLAGRMIANRDVGFNPYPFILLNLILSCVAALQGAVLLIAARRSDQITAEVAQHDYAVDQDALRLISEVHSAAVRTTMAASRINRGDEE